MPKTSKSKGGTIHKPQYEKTYSFKDEQVNNLFHLLNKQGMIKIPKKRGLEEAEKTNDPNPNYCLFH